MHSDDRKMVAIDSIAKLTCFNVKEMQLKPNRAVVEVWKTRESKTRLNALTR